MTPSLRFFLFLVLIGLMVALSVTLSKRGGIDTGDQAPLFTLPENDGRPVALQELRGKVVLLNFWATWCPPCVMEIPSLVRLQDHLRKQGLVVVAVSVGEDWRVLERFSQKIPLGLTVLLDAKTDVAARYGTFRLPESFLIDRSGKILKRYLGPREWTDPALVAEILSYVESS